MNYEPPRIEHVIAARDFEREAHYAGNAMSKNV